MKRSIFLMMSFLGTFCTQQIVPMLRKATYKQPLAMPSGSQVVKHIPVGMQQKLAPRKHVPRVKSRAVYKQPLWSTQKIPVNVRSKVKMPVGSGKFLGATQTKLMHQEVSALMEHPSILDTVQSELPEQFQKDYGKALDVLSSMSSETMSLADLKSKVAKKRFDDFCEKVYKHSGRRGISGDSPFYFRYQQLKSAAYKKQDPQDYSTMVEKLKPTKAQIEQLHQTLPESSMLKDLTIDQLEQVIGSETLESLKKIMKLNEQMDMIAQEVFTEPQFLNSSAKTDNPYKVLGIPKDATKEQMNKAVESLAQQIKAEFWEPLHELMEKYELFENLRNTDTLVKNKEGLSRRTHYCRLMVQLGLMIHPARVGNPFDAARTKILKKRKDAKQKASEKALEQEKLQKKKLEISEKYKREVLGGRLQPADLNNPDPLRALGLSSKIVQRDIQNDVGEFIKELKGHHARLQQEWKALQGKSLDTKQFFNEAAKILSFYGQMGVATPIIIPFITVRNWSGRFERMKKEIPRIVEVLEIKYEGNSEQLETLKKAAEAAKQELYNQEFEFNIFVLKLAAAGLIVGVIGAVGEMIKLYHKFKIAFVRIKISRKLGVSKNDIENLHYDRDKKEWMYDVKGKQQEEPDVSEIEENGIRKRVVDIWMKQEEDREKAEEKAKLRKEAEVQKSQIAAQEEPSLQIPEGAQPVGPYSKIEDKPKATEQGNQQVAKKDA